MAALGSSVRLVLLPVGDLQQDAQQGTRCIRRQSRWLFGQLHEEADATGPARGRPLTSACTIAAARKLLIPGGSIGLILLIAHVGLVEPERIRVT
jgi:hypothetical protein